MTNSTASPAVPMLDLRRQYASLREEVRAAVDRVCESQSLILGEEVAAFERETSAFTGAAATVACASGTDALWLALKACGLGQGDTFLTTAFTFFASGSSIVRCGAQPVFADIDPQTFNLDPAACARVIESAASKPKGILPVHLYGQCADMDAFHALAEAHKLYIAEDAAQAYGAAWGNVRAGALGNTAAFSFYPTKNLSAFGDAGAATSSDLDMAEHMRRLRNHGSARRYYHEEFGANSRMDALQGAVLRIKLRHIEDWNRRRRELADNYDRLLKKAGLTGERGTSTEVSKQAPVQLPKTLPQACHIFHQYVLRAHDRNELRHFLMDHNIGCEIYYPVPLHLQACFEYLGYKEGVLPETERACREVLALPIFPELREEEQELVVEAIAEFYSK